MTDKCIRLRFTAAVAHLIILIVILIWKRETIARSLLPDHEMYAEDSVKMKWFEQKLANESERLVTILASGIGLISVEMSIFLIGISMFKNWQCLLSFICHLSGACASLYLLHSGWHEDVYVVIFFLCILLPVLSEGVILIRYVMKNI